ncbi:MAG: hypothetical protein QOE90_1676 [Thermoplasmata archaeon]|jgi:hypothetical protein|nr:hypothetical protein [Thermoplasmata archaeon]
MNAKSYILSAAILALVATTVPASAIGSTANPFAHPFYGVSATSVVAGVAYDDGNGNTFSLSSATGATVVGLCADLPGITGQIIPVPNPLLVFDQDMETGVGGACFPFVTAYGSDVGTTQTVEVSVQSPVLAVPVWTTCVDENGDGVCAAATGDQVLTCWTGGSIEGGVQTDGSGPCSVYIDPAAANPAVFVTVIAGVTVTSSGVHLSSIAPEGGVFYYA